MKLFTSYYDKMPSLDKNTYTLVRVSRKEPPEWFSDEHKHVDLSEAFGPTAAMLEECHPLENWEAFEPRYKSEVLGVLDKGSTLKELEDIYAEHGNKPLLLLCYETSEQNCHRHLIGEYLGMEIEEI